MHQFARDDCVKLKRTTVEQALIIKFSLRATAVKVLTVGRCLLNILGHTSENLVGEFCMSA